jgi:hypothetical protein
MEIGSSVIFLNVTVPFSVLNDVCTGKVELQAIFAENTDGKLFLDSLEQIDITDLAFSNNSLGIMPYKEFQDWCQQVNKLFNCDIDQLISDAAEANIDKAFLENFVQKYPTTHSKTTNSNCCCR